MDSDSAYLHALRYQLLNWLYDPLVRLTTREAAVKSRLIDFLPQDGGSLLDLACGSGTLAGAIKQHNPAYRVMGIDGDEDMLRRAREKSEAAGINQPWHWITIPIMGMTMGEIFNVKELADDCAADGTYEYLFVAPAIPITGAVGSPVNPLAIK